MFGTHRRTFLSPRQGEVSEDVRIRGEPKLVQKIKAELESAVAALRDRVVLGVDIPAVQHRMLIGRGGQHLNELQNKHSVIVQFPGSRSYFQNGEPENAEELTSADPANIVKVSGPKTAVEKAINELKVSHLPQLTCSRWIWRSDCCLYLTFGNSRTSGSRLRS